MKLWEQYNLTGYSTINHCDAEDDDYSYGKTLSFWMLIRQFIAFYFFRLLGQSFYLHRLSRRFNSCPRHHLRRQVPSKENRLWKRPLLRQSFYVILTP